VAIADAGTLAKLRAASRTGLSASGEDAEAQARADAVIAKYIGPDALPLEPEPAAPAAASEAAPAADAPSPDPVPARPVAARRVFGRRGVG
jgi:hypothetical protein